MLTSCAQCGAVTDLCRGRCAECGAATDLGEISRHERRAALLRVIGEEWYRWLGEVVALTLIALVLGDALPIWMLTVAAILLLRPLSRLLVMLLRGVLE